MSCRHCGNVTLERVTRRTAWQKIAAPVFGYYPWRCVRCQVVMLRKTRKGKEKSPAAA